MQKQISIPFTPTLENQLFNVPIAYSIEKTGEYLNIQCQIGNEIPQQSDWLQLRNFQIRSTKTPEGYVQLFDDYEDARNLDTTLFIEIAYMAIMKKEKHKTLSSTSAA